mgnify:CR=1 FL=1
MVTYMVKNIIVVENLVKIYSNGVIANDHINLRVRKGEIVGILGPNGAGKTTLIKQLTGELMPTEGKIYIMDIDVVKNPSAIKPFIGVCPQEGNLISYLTVREHIYYFGRLKGLSRNDAQKEADKILDLLDLKQHQKKKIGELSGGLRRRVFVGIALINEPPIVFLDEPTAGLDPIVRNDFWETIEKIKKEKPETTIIVTTHYLEELDKVSDRLVFINKGKIVLEGNTIEVRSLINYDIKITFPKAFKEVITKELLKEGINFRLNESLNKIDLLLSKKDFPIAMKLIFEHTSDVIVSSPTLDEVFLGVIKGDQKDSK